MGDNGVKPSQAFEDDFEDTPTGELGNIQPIGDNKTSSGEHIQAGLSDDCGEEDLVEESVEETGDGGEAAPLYSFLDTGDELDGFDFGTSISHVEAIFSAGPAEIGDLDGVCEGDETMALPDAQEDDDETSVLCDDDEATSVLDEEDGITTVLAEQVDETGVSTLKDEDCAPGSAKPSRLLIGGIVVVAVLVIAIAVFFLLGRGSGEEPTTGPSAVGYSISYVDQDGKNIVDNDIPVGRDGEEVSVTVPDMEGYKLVLTDIPAGAHMSDDDTEVIFTLSAGETNQVVFHYAKKVTCKVKYLNKDNGKSLKKAKTYKALAGDKVKLEAPKIKGYDLKSDKKESLTLKADSKKNVIIFYYSKYAGTAPSSSFDDEGSGSSYKDSGSSHSGGSSAPSPSFSSDAIVG